MNEVVISGRYRGFIKGTIQEVIVISNSHNIVTYVFGGITNATTLDDFSDMFYLIDK